MASKSAASAATAEFLRDIMSTGAPIELNTSGDTWRSRHFRFNAASGALEAYKGDAIHTYITLRRFQVVSSSSDGTRFHIKTPSKLFVLRAPSATVQAAWVAWLESMQRDQALVDERARLPSTDSSIPAAVGPGGDPIYWIPDAESEYCAGCGKAFSMTRRRHHCRDCGFVLCSSQTCLVPGSKTCQLCVREKAMGGRAAVAHALASRALPQHTPASPVASGVGRAGLMGLSDLAPPAASAAGAGAGEGAKLRKKKTRRAPSAAAGDAAAAVAATTPEGAAAAAAAAAAAESAGGLSRSKASDKWVFAIVALGILFWLYSALAATPASAHLNGGKA